MANPESVTKEILIALREHFDKYIPKLRTILLEFPESNQRLRLPALSIGISNVGHEPLFPYPFETGSVQDHQSEIKYVVGQYNWTLQLDLWAKTKEELHDLYEDFYQGFNNNVRLPGLSLELRDYYGIMCNYYIVGFSFANDEIGSQTKEWRATVDLEANCKAILRKSEYIITDTPELTFTTPREITE